MFTLLSIILRYCKETSTMQNTCFGHFYPIFLGHLSHFKWLFMPIAIRMSGMNALYDIQLTIIVPLTASWVGFKIVSFFCVFTVSMRLWSATSWISGTWFRFSWGDCWWLEIKVSILANLLPLFSKPSNLQRGDHRIFHRCRVRWVLDFPFVFFS